ncbi:MAG: cobaltochelatase subunit CobN [Oscillospiraceae bacterium]|nr:cobaltochelatase subunit CobN [Oscillospiraceae bacterium]
MFDIKQVFCFGCEAEYKIWQGDFENAGIEITSIALNATLHKESREAVLEQLNTAMEITKPLVVFSHQSMNLEVEKFYLSLPEDASILPIGTEAALLGKSTVDGVHVEEINKYLHYSGMENIVQAGRYIRKHLLDDIDVGEINPPTHTPFEGIFSFDNDEVYYSLEEYLALNNYSSYVGLLVNRVHWLRGDLEGEKELTRSIEALGIGVIAVFSNPNPGNMSFEEVAETYFSIDGKAVIELLINTQLFAIRAQDGNSVSEQSVIEFEKLGVPVIFPIRSSFLTQEEWREQMVPLSLDMPSSLITPEMAGMTQPIIISVRNGNTGKSEALPERTSYLANKIAALIRLKTKENSEKKLAIILHNAVCAGVEATIGKAYGLDAFESVVRFFNRLSVEGYSLGEYPETGEKLRELFMEKKAFSDFRWTAVEDIIESGGCLYQMPINGQYDAFYNELPGDLREYMEETWGTPPGEGMVLGDTLIISGIQFGNVIVMVQPKRGCYGAKCTGEVCKILHDPACPPPHQFLGAYRYIERVFCADALIDFGTDGSVEYLPGKANALSERCWPGIVTGSLPSFYIYNAGVINESLMVKRRMSSVIIDHLPPPCEGADEEARQLMRKIDEYFQAKALDNSQYEMLEEEIRSKIEQMPAASRILERSETFDQGLMEVSSAIKGTEQGRNISSLHIFGDIPDEDIITRYIREVYDGDGLELDIGSEDAKEIREALLEIDNEMNLLISGLEGSYIPAGESGMPDENGRNILPTGRNMFGLNADKVPTKTAYERGKILAAQLIESYMEDENRLPERIAMNMISADITKSNGEQLSQFLFLLGIEPIWDSRERVTGLRIMSLDELDRPRIDATVRISGVLRDTWPIAVEMMDEAVLMIAALEENDEDNFILKHLREYRLENSLQDDDDRNGAIRIFGDPPGTYGAGINLALLASAWKDEVDLAKYFIHSSAHAYGGKLNGRKSIREFIDNAKNIDLSYDTSSSKRITGISDNFGVQVQGGYRLIAKHLGNKNIRQYQGTNERNREIRTESLAENLKRNVEETLLNEFWKENITEKGYDGASSIMGAFQSVFMTQCVTDSFTDDFLDRLAEEYINDDRMRQWLSETNKYALEELARRMIELYTREKWIPNEDVLERLKMNYLEIEGDIEEGLASVGDIQGGTVEILNDADIEAWSKQLEEIEKLINQDAKR